MNSKADNAEKKLEATVRTWFTPAALGEFMGPAKSAADRIGREWLLADGKRLRPILTASVFAALDEKDLNRIASVAVAVECFHKASLIHDDIEDGDQERYGLPTVHARYGVPSAINAGDWLIGEGYRLIAFSAFPETTRAAMTRVASAGHRELARGQGDELEFCRAPRNVSIDEVLTIYRQKTASAFEVAVQCGALAAGLGEGDRALLSEFSETIGIAYQIHDDMEDFRSVRGRGADLLALRPTLHLAEACASRSRQVKEVLAGAWKSDPSARARLIDALAASGIPAKVSHRLEEYLLRARQTLPRIRPRQLQAFLQKEMGYFLGNIPCPRDKTKKGSRENE